MPLYNEKLSKIFFEIADRLDMEGVEFKPQAYRRAAGNIKDLEKDVSDIYREEGREGLKKIKGVGEAISEKIEEYLETGKMEYYEDLKEKAPLKIEELLQVEGMGPKRARALYRKLGVADLDDLEAAAKNGRIAPLEGFGEKTEKNIIQAVEFLKASRGRFLLGEILPRVREMERRISALKEVERLSVVGSVRRKKETIGDIDILASPKGEKASGKIMDFFTSLEEVVKIWSKGSTRSSVRLENGCNVDLRVVEAESFGAALQYFTGSKEHNIVTRGIAKRKGMKLNEYGLFNKGKKIAGEEETGIYKALGMEFPPPELRENEGEIEAALKDNLPELVELKDVKGDLHCHTSWDGGVHSIKEMVEKAKELGYEYVGVSDHTKYLRIENGLDEKQLSKQKKEIEELRKKTSGIKILQGAEVNILKDGSLDINEEALAELDYVIAGVHSHLGMSEEEMTERIVRAIKNPYVNIISHPTGRLIKEREEVEIDFEKVLKVAKEQEVALEINSSPVRLDLCDKKIRRAKEAGVKMIVNTDSHNKGHMLVMELGVSQARRGWAEREDIINTWSFSRLVQFFDK